MAVEAGERLGWSVAEAAALLGMSVSGVRAAIKRGDVPAVQFGPSRSRVVVPVDALTRLLASASTGSGGPPAAGPVDGGAGAQGSCSEHPSCDVVGGSVGSPDVFDDVDREATFVDERDGGGDW